MPKILVIEPDPNVTFDPETGWPIFRIGPRVTHNEPGLFVSHTAGFPCEFCAASEER